MQRIADGQLLARGNAGAILSRLAIVFVDTLGIAESDVPYMHERF